MISPLFLFLLAFFACSGARSRGAVRQIRPRRRSLRLLLDCGEGCPGYLTQFIGADIIEGAIRVVFSFFLEHLVDDDFELALVRHNFFDQGSAGKWILTFGGICLSLSLSALVQLLVFLEVGHDLLDAILVLLLCLFVQQVADFALERSVIIVTFE